jgi:hypothetical protein
MNRHNVQTGLRRPTMPGRAAFVLSALGLANGPVLTETSLQRPCRRLQGADSGANRKIRSVSKFGNVQASLWERLVIACAVRAWAMSAGAFPAFPSFPPP